MNESKFAQHLLGELPSLVERNVINAPAAESLRCHYEPQIKPSRAASTGLAISAILGGLLVGAGIILLIAHNWEDLSRPARVVLAMLPLVASVVLAAYTILRRMDSAAWREGSGTFYFLSIGAAIALVSQTYHLYNDLAGFLLVWTLLSLPLMYLLNSGAAYAGCLACIVVYTLEVNAGRGAHWHSWSPLFLLAATMPFYLWHAWKRRESLLVTWLSWALAAAVLVMMGTIFDYDMGFGHGYGVMFVVYYLVSCCWFAGMRGWRAPFRSIGTLGIAVTSVTLTFSGIYSASIFGGGAGKIAGVCLAVIYLAWLLLAAFTMWRKKYFNWAAACFPVVLALMLPIKGLPMLLPSMPLIMTAYVLFLGVFTFVSGTKRDSLLSMNEGAVLIAALVVTRFFNDDYSFVARGVAFIVAGCGFLAMNLLVMNRRRKQNMQEQEGAAS